jgi:ABC-type molybdate transport system permease subunit
VLVQAVGLVVPLVQLVVGLGLGLVVLGQQKQLSALVQQVTALPLVYRPKVQRELPLFYNSHNFSYPNFSRQFS